MGISAAWAAAAVGQGGQALEDLQEQEQEQESLQQHKLVPPQRTPQQEL